MFSPLGQSDVNCEVKVLHGVSLKLLQMVYLCYQGVYTRLHEVVAKGSPITDKARYNNYWFGLVTLFRITLSYFSYAPLSQDPYLHA